MPIEISMSNIMVKYSFLACTYGIVQTLEQTISNSDKVYTDNLSTIIYFAVVSFFIAYVCRINSNISTTF
jgi:hypothetical protein